MLSQSSSTKGAIIPTKGAPFVEHSVQSLLSARSLQKKNTQVNCYCNLSVKLYQSRHFKPLYLTHFSPVSHFYTPLKCQKTKDFLTLSGGIEM